MRKTALLITAAAALLAGPALQAKAPKLTGEERLAKLLEGRVAGKPVRCINNYNTRDARIIDKTAIVYDSGRTIYVNRPTNARSLDSDDIMVTTLVGSNQLCDIDVVRTVDRGSFFYTGFVGLQEFVPYTRVATRD